MTKDLTKNAFRLIGSSRDPSRSLCVGQAENLDLSVNLSDSSLMMCLSVGVLVTCVQTSDFSIVCFLKTPCSKLQLRVTSLDPIDQMLMGTL